MLRKERIACCGNTNKTKGQRRTNIPLPALEHQYGRSWLLVFLSTFFKQKEVTKAKRKVYFLHYSAFNTSWLI
jgi:hypothetical protein